MTKNQRARLDACNTALQDVIKATEEIVAMGETTREALLLAQTIKAVTSIQNVLGGVIDELK